MERISMIGKMVHINIANQLDEIERRIGGREDLEQEIALQILEAIDSGCSDEQEIATTAAKAIMELLSRPSVQSYPSPWVNVPGML